MSDLSTVKAYCLKVPKNLGEKAIRLTAKLGILNKDLKVRSIDGDLYIPLNQKPQPEHVTKFNEVLRQFDITVQDFSKRVKLFRDVFEVLEDKLPPHLLTSFPRSIDFVGDIAIIEIPPELETHKKLVGKAILKVHKHVRTVLAKSSAVGGVHRLREYDVIAGSSDTETIHKEHGCKYHLDVRKVYFSPRLSFEHNRVASQVEENETVIDMFAGVGPFSVLIAKTHRAVKVYAVDINPDAVRYLRKNILVNGVLSKVVPVLGDIRKVVHERLRGTADRVIMNLPEKAMEYLGTACEAMKPEGGVIHYYEFAEGRDVLEAVKKRLIENFNREDRRVEKFLSARIVREVAPFKWQVSVDLRVR